MGNEVERWNIGNSHEICQWKVSEEIGQAREELPMREGYLTYERLHYV